MKIGLVAMSGVRISDPELLELGLNLPGFVERSEVIASLPSLSLLTLAALTPPEIEVEYMEAGDLEEGADPPHDWDLAAISTYTAQSGDAYALADRWRAQGLPVVLGGLHATVEPAEASQHVTSVVVGEGEPLWPQMIDDFAADRLKPIYRSPHGELYDLAHSPIPRFEMLDLERYNRLTVQTARGCPHRCDFCAASPLLTPRWSLKPVDRVIAEIRRIRELWPQPFIEFADDNSFASPRRARELLTALRDEKIRWFTETDISIADHPDLLDLLHESGCRQILVGLESPSAEGVDGIELRGNWKRRRVDDAESAVRRIQERGITVNGCFVLGLDGDTEEVFDAVYDFVDRTGLYEVQVTVMTPFPGTPLHERLRREGRLIEENAWDRCTLFDVNHVPRQMTPERLRAGLRDLMTRLYAAAFVRDRRERFFHALRRRGVTPVEALVA